MAKMNTDPKVARLPLTQTLSGLAHQMEKLAAQAGQGEDFDKAVVDNIFAAARTAAKIDELASAAKASKNEDDVEGRSTPELLNLIEERIDILAQERAALIIDKEPSK